MTGVHWREAATDGLLLGAFMLSAGGIATLLYAPASPLSAALPGAARDWLMGLGMGLTVIVLITSPAGQRSGAQMNPAVTLSFWRLGKIAGRDAVAYLAAQLAGGVLGVLVVTAVLGEAFSAAPVRSAVTVPGPLGPGAAFVAEWALAFVLFLTVLVTTNHPRWMRWTAPLVGALLTVYIALETPISGMSINPARTFASAMPSGVWTSFWIYLVAPVAGMLAAAETFVRARGLPAVLCAKLHHTERHSCHFRCGFCRHPDGAGSIEAPSERSHHEH